MRKRFWVFYGFCGSVKGFCPTIGPEKGSLVGLEHKLEQLKIELVDFVRKVWSKVQKVP